MCYNVTVRNQGGVNMKYKILEREESAEKLGYRFFIDKCEDESGNIVYCLVARALRSKEEICLFENSVFITYTQINQEIKEYGRMLKWD